MKVDLYNFVSALNCILAQRLVRKICTTASEPTPCRGAARGERPRSRLYEDTPFYEGVGCIECNGTGYHGRDGVTELLDLSDPHPRADPGQTPAAEISRPPRKRA